MEGTFWMTTIVTTSGISFATLAADRGITSDLAMPDMQKIVIQGKWLVGVSGDVRACDLIQYAIKFPAVPQRLLDKEKQEWFGWIVLNVVPRIRHALAADTDLDFEVLLVTHGRSFLITSDLGVLDPAPYWSIGSGSRVALGYLASAQYNWNWEDTHQQTAKQAIEISSMFDLNTRGSIDLYISESNGKVYRG